MNVASTVNAPRDIERLLKGAVTSRTGTNDIASLPAEKQRLLYGAAAGVPGASQAFGELALTDKNIQHQVLESISSFLLASHPSRDRNLDRNPHNQEMLANLALGMISDFGTNGTPETIPGVISFISTKIPHILRWLPHLFETWAFKRSRYPYGSTADALVPTSDNDTGSSDRDVLRRSVRDTVPNMLMIMSGHPELRFLLKTSSAIGSLLAFILLVSLRDDDHKLMEHITLILQHFQSSEWDGGHPLKSAFIQTLNFRSMGFAEHIVSRLRKYSRLPRLDHSDAQYLYFTLMHLLTHVPRDDTLLDACLEQRGMIRALTSILCNAIRSLARETPNLHIFDNEKTPAYLILTIPRFLAISLRRGGPSLIAVALDCDLLGAALRLRKAILQRTGCSGVDDMSIQGLSQVLDSIVSFAVYPSVLKRTYNFFDDYGRRGDDDPEGDSRLQAKFPMFYAAFERLKMRLDEEFEIVNAISVSKRTYSRYSDPYKFCDNLQCPYAGVKRKLGRCTRCTSAYYCSRYCQKLGWRDGHEKECKEMTESFQDGKEVFPPILTNHDHQYLRNTLLPRFHYYYKLSGKSSTSGLLFSNDAVFDMDLTLFSAGITYFKTRGGYRESIKDTRSLDAFSGHPGPLLFAKFPQGSKWGDGYVVVSASGVTPPSL